MRIEPALLLRRRRALAQLASSQPRRGATRQRHAQPGTRRSRSWAGTGGRHGRGRCLGGRPTADRDTPHHIRMNGAVIRERAGGHERETVRIAGIHCAGIETPVVGRHRVRRWSLIGPGDCAARIDGDRAGIEGEVDDGN